MYASTDRFKRTLLCSLHTGSDYAMVSTKIMAKERRAPSHAHNKKHGFDPKPGESRVQQLSRGHPVIRVDIHEGVESLSG